MKTQVAIIAKDIRSTELKELLQHQLNQSHEDIVLETRKRELDDRSIDPTILVAIVGIVSTGLGALIKGIWEVAKQKFARTIIIQTPAGSRIEVPVGVSSEELDLLVKKAMDLDANREAQKKDSDKEDIKVLIL